MSLDDIRLTLTRRGAALGLPPVTQVVFNLGMWAGNVPSLTAPEHRPAALLQLQRLESWATPPRLPVFQTTTVRRNFQPHPLIQHKAQVYDLVCERGWPVVDAHATTVALHAVDGGTTAYAGDGHLKAFVGQAHVQLVLEAMSLMQ